MRRMCLHRSQQILCKIRLQLLAEKRSYQSRVQLGQVSRSQWNQSASPSGVAFPHARLQDSRRKSKLRKGHHRQTEARRDDVMEAPANIPAVTHTCDICGCCGASACLIHLDGINHTNFANWPRHNKIMWRLHTSPGQQMTMQIE